MVAGLTADVFVQLTATLAHLSSTLNKTGGGGGGDGFYPPLPLPPPRPPNRNPYDGYRKGRKEDGHAIDAFVTESLCRGRPSPLLFVTAEQFCLQLLEVFHKVDFSVLGFLLL